MTFSPGGEVLVVANQDSSSLACFMVDAVTGELAYVGQKFPLPSPACIVFAPSPPQ